MQYGYFDEKNREYVITNPATPGPWVNYLGDPAYGAIVSNNAGGYSFEKSGAKGRILRYHFNDVDDPGRYVYIRDDEDGDFWSASWQPVGKPLDTYKNECRHGTAYTEITAEYHDVVSKVLYYVPMGKTYEVWRVRLENKGKTDRKLSVFGYCEFTTESDYETDQVNLQYSQFIPKTYFHGNRITMVSNENCVERLNGSIANYRFFGLAGAPVVSADGDKKSFIGMYNGYGKPAAVQNGKCSGTMCYNTNPCGALHTEITLKAGESKEFLFALGQKNIEDAAKIMDSYSDVSVVDAELAELKEYWHGKLDNFRVETPDEKFNAMLNTWNAFQCFITFVWSRAASLIYCGQRNGYGYRDTVQDIQGIIHLDPEKARELLTFMLSAQVNNGAGLPLVKYTHNAGHEDTPDDDSYVRETGHPHYRADDAMWLFPTVYKYIAETGNAAYLDEVIPFANKEEGTVYEHLKRAIDFTLNHLAAHKMPAGLHADWNDCLRMGEKGESTFVAMQLYMAMNILKGFAEYKNDADYVDFLTEKADELYNIIQKNCWNEDRFIRGIREDGVPVGARTDIEASMWLNPQSWGVISGVSTNEQAEISLEKVHEILNTPYGVSLLYPPYEKHFFPGALMALFNPYTKENGGIFSQPQGWLILAESLMGHGNRAYEYFCESSPAYMNDKAEIRVLEPYVHGQFTESKGSPFAGRSHVHWLTGTASTVMVGCVEGICGMRPGIDYIDICPALPAEWKSIKIDKVFRGKKLHITVLNPDAKQGKVTNCVVNGEKLDGYRIPVSMLKDENEIVVNY